MRKRSGYILLLTIMVTAALIFFTTVYLTMYNSQKSVALRGEQDLIAAGAASAGIDESTLQLKTSGTWTTGFDHVQLPHSKAYYTVTFDQNNTYKLPYSTNNSSGTAAVQGYDRSVPAGMIYLISVGQAGLTSDPKSNPSGSTASSSTRYEEALVSTGFDPFHGAVVVQTTATFHGSNASTDSYDSALGVYPAGLENVEGDVRSNQSSSGTITMTGHGTVGGNLIVGPGGSQSVSINAKNATYNGFAVGSTLSFPEVTVPTGATVITPPATITTPGNYVVNGPLSASITVSSTIGGAAKVYVNGDITIGPQDIINPTGVPGDLLVFGTSACTAVKIHGNGTATFALYAPDASITFDGNNAEVFGAITGMSATFNAGHIHYDRELDKLLVGGGVTVNARWAK